MAMDDAARFVQNKWNWFQTVGKALMKGKKRKGKGKGKKKKKWSVIVILILNQN